MSSEAVMIHLGRILFILANVVGLGGLVLFIHAIGGPRGRGEFDPELTTLALILAGIGLVGGYFARLMGSDLHRSPAGDRAHTDALRARERAILGDTAPPAPRPAPPADPGPAVTIRPKIAPLAGATSWIGGKPSLRPEVPWPGVDGHPATFLAQIDCSQLPDGIWQGLGPRSGWLIFFGHPDYATGVRVYHSEVIGEPRTIPPGVTYRYVHPKPFELRAAVTGAGTMLPPGWPLEIVPADREPETLTGDMIGEALYEWRRAADLADPAYQPYDWTTAKALCLGLRKALDMRVNPQDHFRSIKDAPPEDLTWRSQSRALETLDTLIDRTFDVPDETPFDDARRGRLIAGLQAITFIPGRKDTGALIALPDQPNALTEHYAQVLDLEARHAFTEGRLAPDAAVATGLTPAWQAEAAGEEGRIGGRPIWHFRECGASGDAICLLALPCSALVGWTFGDMSDWGVFISPEDLKARNFPAAYAMDTHGG